MAEQKNPESRGREHEGRKEGSRPDKYNDQTAGGNIFGGIPRNVEQGASSNNGRTPVNPEADDHQEFEVHTNEGRFSTKTGGPAEA